MAEVARAVKGRRGRETCSVAGCAAYVWGRGWCAEHYERARSNGGDPLAPRRKLRNGEALAWVLAVPANAPCGTAEWPFSTGPNGYGRVTVDGKRVYAHRAILVQHVGPPPADKPFALHRCGRRTCCAPGCLYWGDLAENYADAQRHGTLPTRGTCSRCEQPHYALGLCRGHYNLRRRALAGAK